MIDLQKLGGDTMAEACRRLLRYTMDDGLAEKFNWKGSGGKRKMESTFFKELIIS